MEFWRRSARIYRKDKVGNTIIKQKMKVTRSFLDDSILIQNNFSGLDLDSVCKHERKEYLNSVCKRERKEYLNSVCKHERKEYLNSV